MLRPTRWFRTLTGEKKLRKEIEKKRRLEQKATMATKAKKTSMRPNNTQSKTGVPKKSVKATTKVDNKKSLAGAGARVKAQVIAPSTRTPTTHAGVKTRSSSILPKPTPTSRPRKAARLHSPASTTSTDASASTSSSLDSADARGPVRRSARRRLAAAETCASFAALSLNGNQQESDTLANPTAPTAHALEDDQSMEVELDLPQAQDLASADSPGAESSVETTAVPNLHVSANEEVSETQQCHNEDTEGVSTTNRLDPIPEEGDGNGNDARRARTATSSNSMLPSTTTAELGAGQGPSVHVHVHVHSTPAPAFPPNTGYAPHSFPPIPPPPQWNMQQQVPLPHGYPCQYPPMGPPPAHPGYFQPHFGHGWYPPPPQAPGYVPPAHGYPYAQPPHAPPLPGYAPAPHPYMGYHSGQPQPPHVPPHWGQVQSAASTSHHGFHPSAQGPWAASSSSNAQPAAPQTTSGRSATVWRVVPEIVIIPDVVLPSRVPAVGEKLIWCGHISAEKKWDKQAQDMRNPRCNHLIPDTREAIQNHWLHIHGLNWVDSYQKCNWGSSCKRTMRGEKMAQHIIDVHLDGSAGLCEGKGCKLARVKGKRWCASQSCRHVEPFWANRDASQNFV